jgi:hypothetical protein
VNVAGDAPSPPGWQNGQDVTRWVSYSANARPGSDGFAADLGMAGETPIDPLIMRISVLACRHPIVSCARPCDGRLRQEFFRVGNVFRHFDISVIRRSSWSANDRVSAPVGVRLPTLVRTSGRNPVKVDKYMSNCSCGDSRARRRGRYANHSIVSLGWTRRSMQKCCPVT